MAKIKSIKEQYIMKDLFLKERLSIILPKVMNEYDIDMWITASREYNEDPFFHAITPSNYPTARRISMFAFVREGDKVLKLSLCMPSEELEPYYTPYWTDFNSEDQMDCLNRLIKQYNPKNILMNVSHNFAFSDGMSMGLYEMITSKMDKESLSKIIRNDEAVLKVMEIRTPSEMSCYPEIVDAAFSVIEDTFSKETIIPGKTTCEDLQYHMMQKVKDMGLDYWFEPTIDLQRPEIDEPRYFGVIEKGDLLHCDFGIKYMNQCTDTQRLAYVARDNEEEIPKDILDGMKINDRFQDIVASFMAEGKTGNEVLAQSLNKAKEEGIEAVLYSHPCNMYGHGPGTTIGLWNNQKSIPIRGDIKISYNTTFALELNTKAKVFDKDYYFFTEETVAFTEEGLKYLHEGRKEIYFVKCE